VALDDCGVSGGGSTGHLTSGTPFDTLDAGKSTRYVSNFFPSKCSHSPPSISPLYNFLIAYDASCFQKRIVRTASRRNLHKLYCGLHLLGLTPWANGHPTFQGLCGGRHSKLKPLKAQTI
jgi:hypothetical protein